MEMVTATINPNLSSKYSFAGSHISAPDGSVTTQPFKAKGHFSNYLAKSRKIEYIIRLLKYGNSNT